MKRKIRVSAPGKLIILGEHSVVYGKPALVASVAKRCFVTLTPGKDKEIKILSENLDQQLDYPKIIISKAFEYFKKKIPSGFTLHINSEIPIGAGMGSSAALAVSIAAAVSLFLGKKLDKEKINQIAYLCEQKKHGNPSGVDNSACCYGGLIWFRKEAPDLKIISKIPFDFSGKIAKKFLTIFSGKPKESTKKMINIVGGLYKERPEFTRSIFSHQESLTRELLSALKNGNEETIKSCIKSGEKNLEKLGVVSAFIKSFIREVKKNGGAAKICGAGGRTKEAGILLAFHQKPEILEELAKKYNFTFSKVSFDTQGVRHEL